MSLEKLFYLSFPLRDNSNRNVSADIFLFLNINATQRIISQAYCQINTSEQKLTR